MPNMEAIISGHNKKLLKKETSQESKPCNSRNKDICPSKRILPTAIYHFETEISHKNQTESYIGCSGIEFK